jgi:ABC-type nitrate/sulfonate/bicarbonate transport system substrate-binding protein
MNFGRILRFGLAITLVTLNFAGCRHLGSGGQTAERVTLATSKNPWSALTIIAQKKGFFKEEGVEVDLQYVQAAKLAMDALVSGSTQFSNVVETNLAFLGFTNNTDIEIIATHCESHDGAIIARTDAKIQSPKDLEGKKLGVLQGTTSQVFADRFIEKYKLDRSKIQIVNLTPVAIQSSILSKDIDAGSIWQPFVYNVKRQLGDGAVIFADDQVYVGYFNLAVQRDWARQHPQAVAAVLRAHLKAEEFARANREAAIELVAQEIGIEKEAVAQFWSQYVYRVQIRPQLAQEIARQGEWIRNTQSQHQGQPLPSYQSAVDDTYLRAVAPDRVVQ